MIVPRKLAHKGLALLGVLLIFELFFLASLAWLVQETQREGLKQAESKEIAGKICHLFRTITETVTPLQEHQGALTDEDIQNYKTHSAVIREEMNKLSQAVKKYPAYRNSVDKLVKTVRTALRLAEIGLGMDKSIDPGQRMAMMATVASKFNKGQFEAQLLNQVDITLRIHERTIARATSVQQGLRNRIELLLGFAVLLNIGFAIGLGAIFVNGIAGRISILTDNADRIARGLPLNAAFRSEDEIGQLDRSFRKMAAALAEAARKERAIVANASDVIFSLDKTGQFVKVNPAAKRIWGQDGEKLIGEPFSKLLNGVKDTVFESTLNECMTGTRREFEVTIARENEPAEMLCSARWSETEGNLYCVAHDITERKKAENLLKASERRLHALLDNMLVGLLISTPDGVIDSSNSKLEEMVDYKSSDLQGKPIATLFPRPKFIAPTKPGSSIELELKHHSGEEIPVELSVTEFRSSDGPRLLTNLVDISERRAIEKTKQEFLAMVSHDLRTPLSSVSAYLELLAAGLYGKLTPQETVGAEEASQNAFRLLALISDLLEITRMETSKMDLKFKSESLEELVESVMDQAQDMAEEREVKIEYKLEDADFQADFQRLKRVVTNLITNAMNCSKQGDSVVLETLDLGSSVEFSVTDRGPLIEESEKDLLFDRLSRNKSERLKAREGSGLGLPICKAIVEQHGGSIGIECSKTIGCKFWVRIPKKQGGSA